MNSARRDWWSMWVGRGGEGAPLTPALSPGGEREEDPRSRFGLVGGREGDAPSDPACAGPPPPSATGEDAVHCSALAIMEGIVVIGGAASMGFGGRARRGLTFLCVRLRLWIGRRSLRARIAAVVLCVGAVGWTRVMPRCRRCSGRSGSCGVPCCELWIRGAAGLSAGIASGGG